MRLEIWDNNKAERELQKRLAEAKGSRLRFEKQWRKNEEVIYSTSEGSIISNLGANSVISDTGIDEGEGTQELSVNYVLRDVRFIHSQMSANPPTVVPRPTSSDPSDRQKADAADRLIRHAIRRYKMQEYFDRSNLNLIVYGTTFFKGIWNPNFGEILEFDEGSGDIQMEGDYDNSVPSVWDIFAEPAPNWDEVRYVFQRFYIPWEEACFLFDAQNNDNLQKVLQSCIVEEDGEESESMLRKNQRKGLVKVYQYWEKGLPYNGMQGRFCWCSESGVVLSPVQPNPHRFSIITEDGRRRPAKARLPFHIATDIDIPNTYYGQSMVSYSAELQSIINRLDTVSLECIKAHGIPRMILPGGVEIRDDSITNSPWDIIKLDGNQPPYFMEALPLPATINAFRAQLQQGIMDVNGVNESVFGQQSREQSGASMQYATQQSNMMRRRLFNKYVMLVEAVYRDYLDIIRENWDTPRIVQILGKEKAFESVQIKGADITGGFDLVVEYGTSLSLDPMMRREEIMTLLPVFEKAGVQPRTILGMMKLSELDRAYDSLQLAEDHQREFFEEMRASGKYIKPKEMQDHKNMLVYAYEYLMTAEYKYLADNVQALIEQHIKEREQLVASQAAPAPGAAPEAMAAPAPEQAAPPPDLAALLGGG